MRSIVPSQFALAACLLSLGCDSKPADKKETLSITAPPPVGQAPTGPDIADASLELFRPALPERFDSQDHPTSKAKVELGRTLYFDPRLSKNHDLSCNTCHVLGKYGVDNKPVSDGHKGQRGVRNSPTVYNAAGHFVQFWDGRSPDVEHQATQPVMNPVEMAMGGEKQAAAVLRSIPEYVAAFKAAFPNDKDPVNLVNAGKAMGAFERGLVTPSRWDQYLNGDKTVLTAQEKQGFSAFMSRGCIACHTGTLVGGTTYQKLGAVKPWPNQKDQGRFEVTKIETDRMLFKVPSLRNVAETEPYFHDGSVATLDEAVRLMALHQLGTELTADDTASIVAWLKTLTGELPADYIKMPALPASTAKTPAADPT